MVLSQKLLPSADKKRFVLAYEYLPRSPVLVRSLRENKMQEIRTVMRDAGSALMGIGYATGEDRAKQAAERALKSPLIDTEIVGARGILLSIAGGEDLTLLEVNDAAETVRQAATDDTNIIFGATVDERLAGQVWVTVVATGLGGTRRRATPTFVGDTSPRRAEDPLEPPSFLRQ